MTLPVILLPLSVSLPTDAVSGEDGNGTKNRTATAAPNINKEIPKGIRRFLMRDFFSDDVSLMRFLTSHAVSDILSSCSNSSSPLHSGCLFTSRDNRANRNLVLSSSKRLRNGREEDL